MNQFMNLTMNFNGEPLMRALQITIDNAGLIRTGVSVGDQPELYMAHLAPDVGAIVVKHGTEVVDTETDEGEIQIHSVIVQRIGTLIPLHRIKSEFYDKITGSMEGWTSTDLIFQSSIVPEGFKAEFFSLIKEEDYQKLRNDALAGHTTVQP